MPSARGGQGGGWGAHEVLAGGSLGFAWKVSPTVRLVPELSVLSTVWGPDLPPGGNSPYLQGGVGVVFDGPPASR